MSEHETESQFKTTPEMEEIGLYYKSEEYGVYYYFWKTSAGKFKPKKEHTSNRGMFYIRHKNSNYTKETLSFHIHLKAPLKKGILSKYAPRKRKAKLSLLDRLIRWLKG